MKDIFKETEKSKEKIVGCPICGHGEEKRTLHRKVRRFLKQLLHKEAMEVEDDSQSRQ